MKKKNINYIKNEYIYYGFEVSFKIISLRV